MLRLQVEKILKDNNLTITKNRKDVLKIFLDNKKPLELKSIRSLLKHIDRVTVFRILGIFERNQIIHKIHFNYKSIFYALCNNDCHVTDDKHSHNHIHFVCEECNDVSCVSIGIFPKITLPQHVLKSFSINASGLCSKCNV